MIFSPGGTSTSELDISSVRTMQCMLDIFFKTDLLIKVQWADQVALLSLGSGLEMTNSVLD